MLIKHSVMYFFARGLPGLVNLAALIIYTRLLSPQAYGQYALVIAGIVMAYAVLYQWLHLGILRFYAAYENKQRDFLVTVLTVYLFLSVVIGLLAFPGLLFLEDAENQQLVAIGIVLLWFHAFHELNLHVTVVKGKPKDYALYGLLKSLLGLSCGVMLVSWFDYSVYGAILGTLIGLMLAGAIGYYRSWYAPILKHFKKDVFFDLFRYGLPLTATSALAYIVSSSDRFIIGWLIDIEAVGKYSVGYDIPSYTLIVIMVIINTAAYPLVVKALEREGVAQATKQLSANFTLLWAIAFPSAVGIALLATPLSLIMVGTEFREDASLLIPWVSVAILLNGMRIFYVDISFQLGKKTSMQIWGVLVAALLNMLLNFLWVPMYGILGAAYSSVVAFSSALIINVFLGRNIFTLPFPVRDFLKVIMATLLMVVTVIFVPHKHELLGLLLAIFLGAIVYFTMTYVFNVAGSKKYVSGILIRLKN